jgi:hypothetical protein
VRIVRGVRRTFPFPFTGRYFRVEGAAVPPPVQTPRVPLLIAGDGEQVTLRQVARYADMCNFGEQTNTGGARTLGGVESVRGTRAMVIGTKPAWVEELRRKLEAPYSPEERERIRHSLETIDRLNAGAAWPQGTYRRLLDLAQAEDTEDDGYLSGADSRRS